MGFDIDRYKQRSAKLDLTGLEWDRIAAWPLSPECVRTLVYMTDIETHTAIYLSELLVTSACKDPDITAFLSVWAYEEMFHGDALRRFLAAAGHPLAPDHTRILRDATDWGRIRATLTVMLASKITDAFPAIYLTIGAINELTTITGYARLAQVAHHPVLTHLLGRISKQERAHYAFYRSQAEARLGASRLARRLTRLYLERTFVAVGEDVKPLSDIDDLALHLFADEAGREAARHVDLTIGRLPGMSGIRLLQRTRERALARCAPQPPAVPRRAVA